MYPRLLPFSFRLAFTFKARPTKAGPKQRKESMGGQKKVKMSQTVNINRGFYPYSSIPCRIPANDRCNFASIIKIRNRFCALRNYFRFQLKLEHKWSEIGSHFATINNRFKCFAGNYKNKLFETINREVKQTHRGFGCD